MEDFLEEAVSCWNLMIEFGRIYPGRVGGVGANERRGSGGDGEMGRLFQEAWCV